MIEPLPGRTRAEELANRFKLDPWSEEEWALLREHWPDHEKLKEVLPHRTLGACRKIAGKMRLTRKHFNWSGPAILRLRRLYPKATWPELREGFPGVSVAAIHLAARRFKIRREKAPVRDTGNYIVDSIRKRAIEHKLDMYELDDFTGGTEYFRKHKRLRYVNFQRVVAAVELLGGRLIIEWDDLEDLAKKD